MPPIVQLTVFQKIILAAGLGNLTSGSGVPSGGTDGDYYIDTVTGFMYGPKSGTWPAALLVDEDAALLAWWVSQGVTFDDTTDDTAAIQAVIDTAATGGVSEGPCKTLLFPHAAKCKITAALEIDVAKVGINFNKCRITSTHTTGNALHVFGSDASPYGQQVNELANFYLVGPGSGNASAYGLAHYGSVTNSSAGCVVRNFKISGYGSGIYTNAHSWGVEWYNPDIFSCGYCVNITEGTDAGEGYSIFGGALFNSTMGLRVAAGNTMLSCFGTRIDYNTKFAEVLFGGQLTLYGCNLEWNSTTASPIRCDGVGCMFYMYGGKLLFLGDPAALTHIIDVGTTDTHYSSAIFDGVWMYNLENTANRFATGGGWCIRRNIMRTAGNSSINTVIGTSLDNAAIDGGFESATTAAPTTSILDNVFVLEDGGAITDRYSSTNGQINIVTTPVRTGSKALELQKLSAAGNTFKVGLVFPVLPGNFYGGELYERGDGTVTGTWTLKTDAASIRETGLGYPAVVARFGARLGSETITPDSTYSLRTMGWGTPPSRHPSGPAKAGYGWGLIEFDLTSLGIGKIYIDDVHLMDH